MILAKKGKDKHECREPVSNDSKKRKNKIS